LTNCPIVDELRVGFCLASSENASSNSTSAGELPKPAELVTSHKRKSTADNESDEPAAKKPASGICKQLL